jgi:signal transduction histidine kinase
LYKAAPGGSIKVSVTLAPGLRLRVCDDGAPVPAALAEQILRAPVKSDSGLGIGLFQTAKFAGQSGYALTLAENRDGCVCFELARKA